MFKFFSTALSGQDAIARELAHPADAGAGSGGSVTSPPSGGSGSGAGSDGGSDGGGGSSGGSGARGAAGAGSGSPYRLTDDSLIVGDDGKPVKWGEYRSSRYMPKAEYDRGVDFLMKVADGFDKLAPKTKPKTEAQPKKAADPFEGIDDLPVVDGRTFAKLGRQLVQEGFGPLGQAIQALAKQNEELKKELGTIKTSVGSTAERESGRDFEDHISTVLANVPEIKGLGMVDAKDPAIREALKDLWLSHDQKDPSLHRDYPKMAAERIEALFKSFLKMQQAHAKASKEKAKSFFDPARGRAVPSGERTEGFKSGADIAAMARDAGLWESPHTT